MEGQRMLGLYRPAADRCCEAPTPPLPTTITPTPTHSISVCLPHPHTHSRAAAQGLSADTRTFNAVLMACNVAGQHAEAVAAYERMCSAGIEPSAGTYNAAIAAHCKLGSVETALSLLEEMVSGAACVAAARAWCAALLACVVLPRVALPIA